MPWIKKNIDKVVLLAASLLLIIVSALVYLKSQSFAEENGYDALKAIVQGTAPKDSKIASMPEAAIQEANKELHTPAQWTRFDLEMLGPAMHVLVKTAEGVESVKLADIDGMFYPPVPNTWLKKNGFELTQSDVLSQDPDQDGFSNLDEWLGEDPEVPVTEVNRKSTDPVDAKSHPPFLTKLSLVKTVEVPLLIEFSSKASDDTFIINAGGSSQFLSIGDMIEERPPGESVRKRFKLIGFKEISKQHPTLPMMEDFSELTVENIESKEKVVLVVKKPFNSPDSFAVFYYDWDKTTLPPIKKGTDFSLKPDDSAKYKLFDITNDKAVIIDLKSGKKIEIRRRSTQP